LAVLGDWLGGILGFLVFSMDLKLVSSIAVGLVPGVPLAHLLGMLSPLSVNGAWNNLFIAASIIAFPMAGVMASMFLKFRNR